MSPVMRYASPLAHAVAAPLRAAPASASAAAPGLSVAVEAVTDIAALAALEPEWRALAGQALERNILYSPGMALAAARHLPGAGGVPGAGRVPGAGGVTWLLVWHGEAREGGRRLVAMMPVVLSRHKWGLPLRTAAFWHHVHGFLGTPLIHADHADAAIDALLDWLAGDAARCRFLDLRYVATDGPFHAVLTRRLAARGLKMRHYWRHERALLRGGTDADTYLRAAMPGRRRKEYRRLRARLAELGRLRFTLSSGSEVTAALERFARLEALGWKGRRGTAFASDGDALAFLLDAGAAQARQDGMRICELALDGETIAAAVLLVEGDEGWLWKIAYDETHARFSPGVLLVLELTSALLDEGALRQVDSCAIPGHAMIERIWSERLAMADMLVALKPGAVAAEMAFALEGARRLARAGLKRVWNAARRRWERAGSPRP